MSRILLFLPCLLFLSLASCDFAPGTSSPLSEPSQPLTIAMASETPVPSVPPIENPYSAQPGDDLLTHDRVFLDTQELLIEQGLPPLIVLVLQGNCQPPVTSCASTSTCQMIKTVSSRSVFGCRSRDNMHSSPRTLRSPNPNWRLFEWAVHSVGQW